MDIKWKNKDENRIRSIKIAAAVTVVITLLFMAFMPLFKKIADRNYENPLNQEQVIQNFYESNYVQYKYLKEYSEQKSYSYTDLYYQEEQLGRVRSSDSYEADIYVQDSMEEETVKKVQDAAGEEYISYPGLDQIDWYYDGINSVKDSVANKCSEWESGDKEFLSYFDYYAEDTTNGASISSGNAETLKAILNGKTPEDSPYVYYVAMEYDGVGNVVIANVLTQGDASLFLKEVLDYGRTNILSTDTNFAEDNTYQFVIADSGDSQEGILHEASLNGPSSMRIIYGMTQTQYVALTNQLLEEANSEMEYYFYDAVNNSFSQARIDSFYCFFFLLAIAAGLLLAVKAKRYDLYEMKLCRLPIELYVVLFFWGYFFIRDSAVEMISGYYSGRLFGWLHEQLPIPRAVDLIYIFLVIFLWNAIAFIIGTSLRGITRKGYFQSRSLIYRYGDKIKNKIRQYYQELINFDIGKDAKKVTIRLVVVNFIILTIMCSMWFFGIFALVIYSFILYFLLKKYVKDVQNKYRNLLHATSAIAKGDLDVALTEDFGVFESYKTELKQIQIDFKKAVDEEVKSQRMKSELITNVSHDLKTPLTAIITYIELLKEPGITEEQRAEYIATLDKKAMRLKVLIEDLFEVSKATSRSVTLHKVDMDICNLLRQVYLEYEDKAQEQGLNFRFVLPPEKVIVNLDSQKTYRIVENLYTNILKYAMPHTRVYILLTHLNGRVHIEMKNISQSELQIAPQELTERFVRGDGSRNTEGSGLGLAIAKSFAELQGGIMDIQIDGDLFKVILEFQEKESSDGTEGKASDIKDI